MTSFISFPPSITHIYEKFTVEKGRKRKSVGRFLPSDIVPTGMGGSVGFEDSTTL